MGRVNYGLKGKKKLEKRRMWRDDLCLRCETYYDTGGISSVKVFGQKGCPWRGAKTVR